MKDADFSQVTPDKLVDEMLKLTHLTRQYEVPEMSVRIGPSRRYEIEPAIQVNRSVVQI